VKSSAQLRPLSQDEIVGKPHLLQDWNGRQDQIFFFRFLPANRLDKLLSLDRIRLTQMKQKRVKYFTLFYMDFL